MHDGQYSPHTVASHFDADDRLELDGVLSMCSDYFGSEFDSSAGVQLF